MSETGLASFKHCKNLTYLDLGNTPVTDAGLAPLIDCKSLTGLNLQKTKVTAAKIAELQKALPQWRIEWDGGVIGPTVGAGK